MLCTSEQRRHCFGPIRHTGMYGDASRILRILWINGSKNTKANNYINQVRIQVKNNTLQYIFPGMLWELGLIIIYLGAFEWLIIHLESDAYREPFIKCCGAVVVCFHFMLPRCTACNLFKELHYSSHRSICLGRYTLPISDPQRWVMYVLFQNSFIPSTTGQPNQY